MIHGPLVRWLCVLTVAAGGAVCVGFAAVLAAEDDAVAAAADWPTAPGVVTQRREVERSAPRPGPGVGRPTRPEVWVDYRYLVADREYAATRFGPPRGTPDRARPGAEQDWLPPGEACVVYYDPADPTRSCLEPGPAPLTGLPAACLGAAGALLLSLAGWGVWPRRSAEGAD